ncbi:MAG: nucleotidyltransferase domain-containing protein [Candidatus Omnitrophica bacterium]|nr:nucleotidyltransferase domain-containing protein [Candidatus Omnitrophota bacterium]
MNDFVFKLKSKLTPVFSQDSRIISAYIFGSSIQGLTHPRSDIDLAILVSFDKKFSLDDLLNLEVKITLALKTENYDLVVLNDAPLTLRFRIISEGIIIYKADDKMRCDFEERVMQEYYDFLPRLKEFNAEYFSALRENYLK